MFFQPFPSHFYMYSLTLEFLKVFYMRVKCTTINDMLVYVHMRLFIHQIKRKIYLAYPFSDFLYDI